MADVTITCKCGATREVPDYVAHVTVRCKPCQRKHLKELQKRKKGISPSSLPDSEPQPAQPEIVNLQSLAVAVQTPKSEPTEETPTPKASKGKWFTAASDVSAEAAKSIKRQFTPEEQAANTKKIQHLLDMFSDSATTDDW